MHLISDATGETLNMVARAAAAYYADYEAVDHIYALVRTPGQLRRALAEIEKKPGIVLFTITDLVLRRELEQACMKFGVPCTSILDPVIESLARYLNAESRPHMGKQHALNAEYFRRIEALNFTMAHDDGQLAADLDDAEVVLVGISRTSKTPTSIYLAQRGIKTANIPIVPGTPLPLELMTITKPLVVGLIASAERIAQMRRHRMLHLNQEQESDYSDPKQITQEILFMRKLAADGNWPVIDVTRRSVEETAAAVLNLLNERNAQ
jgi:[pyruvate, water dikinase]-phosphate phosphotransferase / [pyruvate, water dikinase] kinase